MVANKRQTLSIKQKVKMISESKAVSKAELYLKYGKDVPQIHSTKF